MYNVPEEVICFFNHIISIITSQQEGPGSNPGWGLPVGTSHVLLVSAWVVSEYSDFLPHFKDMHGVRLPGQVIFIYIEHLKDIKRRPKC